jgi:DMSO/TMAO reductase YedYZ heme-binding membrane subunit
MRHDLFGPANYTGALGVLILIVLLAASNDLPLRRFGKNKWKQLQRWNYAVFALVAVHAFAFQSINGSSLRCRSACIADCGSGAKSGLMRISDGALVIPTFRA